MSSQLTDQQSQNTSQRGGRFDSDNTIRIKESYVFLFPEVNLNKMITEYIVATHYESKFKTANLNQDFLKEKIKSKQTQYYSQLSSFLGTMSIEQVSQTYYAKIYDIADYFLQFFDQCPVDRDINENEKKKSVLDKQIGKKEWNEVLAGTDKIIPTNIMEVILSQNFNEEHIFGLALLFLYAISNEDIAEKIFNVIIDLYDISSGNANRNNDLEKIAKLLIQFFVCLILRMNHHHQDSPSANSIKNIYRRINSRYSFSLDKDYTIQDFKIIQ